MYLGWCLNAMDWSVSFKTQYFHKGPLPEKMILFLLYFFNITQVFLLGVTVAASQRGIRHNLSVKSIILKVWNVLLLLSRLPFFFFHETSHESA